ncbi:MAG: glycosyltransferase family 4 protein [Chloroflexi bacterium]|nr:glycosyltransferase family 4 protein [Chloroflexota bacterium]
MTNSPSGKPLTVSVFMEVTSSPRTWEGMGILEREMKLLRALCDRGLRVNLISYGGQAENDMPASTRGGVRVLYNWMGLHPRTYMKRVFQVHALPLLRSDVLTSFDTHSMLAMLRAHWAWSIPMVMNMSYSWPLAARINPTVPQSQIIEAQAYEDEMLTKAACVIVANTDLLHTFVDRVPEAASKSHVMALYVDRDLFRPMEREKRYDLIYVGRLARIKNLEAMLEAVVRTKKTIAVIGGGTPGPDGEDIDPQYTAGLKHQFGEYKGIHWLGMKSNEELPAYINQARALMLCSFSEGLPRSMLEALACGVPVIGSRVGGIASTLRHEATGILCETDAESIAAAIDTVFSQPLLLQAMGANARQYALANLSLPEYSRRKVELLTDIARRHPVDSAAKRVASYIMRKR